MAESIELTVVGMKCGGCENTVKKKLGALNGVLSVNASSKDKRVNVVYEASKTDVAAIKAALAEAGYPAE